MDKKQLIKELKKTIIRLTDNEDNQEKTMLKARDLRDIFLLDWDLQYYKGKIYAYLWVLELLGEGKWTTQFLIDRRVYYNNLKFQFVEVGKQKWFIKLLRKVFKIKELNVREEIKARSPIKNQQDNTKEIKIAK